MNKILTEMLSQHHNLIEAELAESKNYCLSDANGLVDLSPRNVSIVEAMILNDSDYSRSSNIKAAPIPGKYKGSTAYWMTKLYAEISADSDKVTKSTIEETICAVDRENSTHLNADSIGVKVMTERIYQNRYDLIQILKDRKRGFQFIAELSRKTSKQVSFTDSRTGKRYFPRENYSFATKFCHYACLFFFSNNDDKQYQDNYSIYDKIVGTVLPKYVLAHKCKKKCYISDFNTPDKYEHYSALIDILRDGKISRNGFDHLLWYYHKSRL